MDNVIDVSNYPLEAQRAEAMAKRRIGLGLTGLADALAMCGLRLWHGRGGRSRGAVDGDDRARRLSRQCRSCRENAAPSRSSIADALLARPVTRAGLPEDLRAQIAAHGIRNGLLTSIAPTGTISLFAGNVSSGIEPIFSLGYDRRILRRRRQQPQRARDGLCAGRLARAAWRRTRRSAGLRHRRDAGPGRPSRACRRRCSAMSTARSRRPSMSRPIFAFDDFKAVYEQAYDLGLKGCTTFRPNDITGSVLSTSGPGPVKRERSAHGARLDSRERGSARLHLQAALAGERPRHLHHHERHRARRRAAPLRDLHQLEEHGTLRLDGGAHAHDLRRVPARRRRGASWSRS